MIYFKHLVKIIQTRYKKGVHAKKTSGNPSKLCVTHRLNNLNLL